MTFKILSEAGEEVPLREGVVVLEESRSYRIKGPGSAANVFLGARRLPWNANEEGFDLPIGFWVGGQELRIEHGGQCTSAPVRVDPRSEKLLADQWLSMLADLEEWLPGGSAGWAGGTSGSVSTEGAAPPLIAASLGPLAPELARVVRALIEGPRRRWVEQEDHLPLQIVKRVRPGVIRWLASHPPAWSSVEGWSVARNGTRSITIPAMVAEDSLDHPVNRYIAWGLRRVIALFSATAETLRRATGAGGAIGDAPAWNDARATELQEAAFELRRLLGGSFLGRLRPEPPSDSAILTLHDEPLYARAHALIRRMTSARFRLAPGSVAAAMRHSYELYELWTFLAVAQGLIDALPDATWKSVGLEGLLHGTGAGARYEAHLPEGQLSLVFNLTFPGYFAARSSDRYSVSRERRPDITLCWQSVNSEGSWLCLDAKYRVGRGNLAEAFESAHLYRDSLRWRGYGGRCRQALLLAPASDDQTAEWFEHRFRSTHGCGAVRMTPGDSTCSTDLASVLLESLRGEEISP